MIGQTISHYKILEKLGEGGMGVVYKAQDTKLERLVALKFLPPHLSASEQDKARFTQEAKAASSLNHPNVCTIHSIEEHDGPASAGASAGPDVIGAGKHLFIVMEYVEGQTLKDRMHNISQKQAIDIGIQVADALAAAHEKAIVHRDIKPENIMIRRDGIAQIMDFGLAKLKGTSRLTKEGSTVGTIGYMSPEQVQGFDTDHRTDIFSLGVLLYEMLAGQSPYRGAHETAIMYEIVNEDPPPIAVAKSDISPDVDAIVLECLAKEPSERYQSAAEVAKDLRRFKRESSKQRRSRTVAVRAISKTADVQEVKLGVRAAGRRFLWPTVSALLALATILFAWRPWWTAHESDRPVMRFSVSLPAGSTLDFGYGYSSLAISPDGKYLVYVSDIGGRPELYVRPMDLWTAQLLTGTEFAGDPFFSPDGRWIAFFAQGRLKKVSIFGGAPQEVCDVKGAMRGGWWAPDNSIYFGHINKGILRVSAAGGIPEEVVSLDSTAGEISHRFPQLLPHGQTLLFTVKHNNISSFDEAVIAAERIGTHERKTVIRGGTFGRYVPTGHIVYARGKSLFAVPFDLDRLEVKGPPSSILDGGMLNQGSGSANFSFSNTGTLVLLPGGPIPIENNTIVWVDRRGNLRPLLDTPRTYAQARLSPDGQKLALTVLAANDDLWVYHLVRGTLTRLTFGGGNSGAPIWSPDGRHVVYSSEKGGARNLFWKPWDGSGSEERMTENLNAQVPNSWNPDGKMMAFTESGDIWILPVEKEHKPWPFLQSPYIESDASFSPEGHWMAFSSNESGKSEVYVVPFPKLGAKWQISNGGGAQPMWSRSGKELFYVNGNTVMMVEVVLQPGFNAAAPRKLFDLPPSFTGAIDLAPNGQRFAVILSGFQELTTTQVNVVLEWFKDLEEKFASSK